MYVSHVLQSIVQRGQQLMEAREHLENHYHEKTTTEAVRPKDLETTKQQPVTTTSDHIRDKQLSVSKPHSCSTIHEVKAQKLAIYYTYSIFKCNPIR